MFVIGTGLNTILTHASAETVLQEIAGLLLSIGNILFWGICTIEQKQTLYVYSETLTNLLDREERLPGVGPSAKIASAPSRVTMSEGGNMRSIADHIERQP